MSGSPIDERIVEMYTSQGMTLAAIGEVIGVCRETVAKRLRRLGFATRKTGPKQGYRQKPEHRQRISTALQAHVKTPEHRQRLSESMTGKLAGDKHPNWNGGVKLRADGYRSIWRPDHPQATADGYVMEHILVIGEVLDRLLEPGEQVHHINGDKADNRPENLMVFRDARDHQMWHQYFRRREHLAQHSGLDRPGLQTG